MIAEELGVNIPSIRSPQFPFRAWYDLATFIYIHSGFVLARTHIYELFLEDRVLDITKAQKELGYDPKVSMREGIQQAVRWYRENGYI
jgi:nucleoside-diphosphate-sugar epimerase